MKTVKNKELIENLESKIVILKEMQIKEGDLYKGGKIQGMIEGFEYSLEEIKKLPVWIPITEKITAIIFGTTLGWLLGMLTCLLFR